MTCTCILKHHHFMHMRAKRRIFRPFYDAEAPRSEGSGAIGG